MEGSQYPAWQKAYDEALLELDPQRLSERIDAAETLIASRLGELQLGLTDPEERRALLDACSALSVIQRPKLSPSESETEIARDGRKNLGGRGGN